MRPLVPPFGNGFGLCSVGYIALNLLSPRGRLHGHLCWHNGYWHKGWRSPAFVTSVAVSIFATCPSYDGCWVYQPTYDTYGTYLGQQCVNVCY